MIAHPRGIPTKKGPSGVLFAYMETPSGTLLKVWTKSCWLGVSGIFPAIPTDVEFITLAKVKVSFASWKPLEAELSALPAPKKNKKRYGRGDNRRRNWKRSYHENRRGIR